MQDYESQGGFNPIKFGVIGAVIVAAIVAGALWVHANTRNKEALQQQISERDQDLEKLKKENVPFQTGEFGADMKVSLTNDGPVTIIIDSRSE